MSTTDTTVTDPPADPPVTDPPADKPDKDDKTDYKAEMEKWKALSRKNEASAKKLQAMEDAQKSELQKAQERIAALEAESQKATLGELRAKVGLEKKLPSTLVDRLKGTTLEEITADADALIKELGTSGGTGNGGGRTQENLQTLITQGGGQGKTLPDMNAFMRSQRGGNA